MSEAIDNAPECDACDGHCCRGFRLYTSHNKKPWSKKNLAKRIAKYYPMLEVHKVFIECGWLFAKCSCNLLIDGKCSDYENRPDFCKTFPYKSLEDKTSTGESCPLAERLLKEMGNTNNE